MSNQIGGLELKFQRDHMHFHLRTPFGEQQKNMVGGFNCSQITTVIDPNEQFEVLVNADNSVHRVNGAGMLRIFKDILKTTLTTAVLARCTIIRRAV